MATLDELLARKRVLEAAKASPVREAMFDGKQVTYRSHQDIANELAAIDTQIAELAGTPVRRVLRMSCSNGLR